MATFLFDQCVFGPVISRRLGISLGINLLPTKSKVCNFSCIYCECGWTHGTGIKTEDLPSRETVSNHLYLKLKQMQSDGLKLDTITYAGNGEPTLHPEFSGIISDTIGLRNKYFPAVKIAVLSNTTLVHREEVFLALREIDYNILKLDSAIEETFQTINKPNGKISVENIVKYMIRFDGDMILQTMFIKGNYEGIRIDNTTEEELDAWLRIVKAVSPKMVMIYTIARDTPHPDLEKISKEKLTEIAGRIEKLGIEVHVSC